MIGEGKNTHHPVCSRVLSHCEWVKCLYCISGNLLLLVHTTISALVGSVLRAANPSCISEAKPFHFIVRQLNVLEHADQADLSQCWLSPFSEVDALGRMLRRLFLWCIRLENVTHGLFTRRAPLHQEHCLFPSGLLDSD